MPKMTGVEFELISDVDMYHFIEKKCERRYLSSSTNI